MQAAADQDRGDFFQFQIGEPSSELQGAPDGGARFPVTALMAGRTFARFQLDVGFGDPLLSAAEELTGQDFLAFAGVPPAKAWAIPKSQQFAEKIHAYTVPWTDRPNTRTKDLIDLVLFITIDPPLRDAVVAAIQRTFELRATHPVPATLSLPPEAWRPVYAAMAREADLNPLEMDEGFRLLDQFWKGLRAFDEVK